jgi:hypothetical protein
MGGIGNDNCLWCFVCDGMYIYSLDNKREAGRRSQSASTARSHIRIHTLFLRIFRSSLCLFSIKSNIIMGNKPAKRSQDRAQRFHRAHHDQHLYKLNHHYYNRDHQDPHEVIRLVYSTIMYTRSECPDVSRSIAPNNTRHVGPSECTTSRDATNRHPCADSPPRLCLGAAYIGPTALFASG